MIALNKIWLFKTSILDPFIFDATDGITATMESERVIDLLTIANADFYFDNTVMGMLSWSVMYGGEDLTATLTTGKSEISYELTFEFPNYSLEMIEILVGNEWACLVETSGRDRIVIFARLEGEGYDWENDQKGQLVLKSSRRSSSRPYKVKSFSVNNVTHTITRDFICDKMNIDNFINIE